MEKVMLRPKNLRELFGDYEEFCKITTEEDCGE